MISNNIISIILLKLILFINYQNNEKIIKEFKFQNHLDHFYELLIYQITNIIILKILNICNLFLMIIIFYLSYFKKIMILNKM